MKTGIELISEERREQIEKHGRTVERDVHENHGQYIDHNGIEIDNPQLLFAASQLIDGDNGIFRQHWQEMIFRPFGWDAGIWYKMMSKNKIQRLVIAGALIAAEIDRLNASKTTTHE